MRLWAWILILCWGCGAPPPAADTHGLDPDDSNIGSDGLGPIVSMQVQPNTMIPKGVLVSLTVENPTFVADLYRLIREINLREGLSGLDGENQEITLVVVTGARSRFAQLQTLVRSELGLPAGAELAYLEVIVDQIADNQGVDDLWMQDFGEFVSLTLAGSDTPVYGVLDTGRYRYRRGLNPQTFAEVFGTPLLSLGRRAVGSGNYGGNIEATPNGRIYVGDTMAASLLREFRQYGRDPLVLPADWLSVGHIDEYVSFFPGPDACGGAIVFADPLLGMVASTTAGDTSLLEYSGEEIASGLDYFRKAGAAVGSIDPADYDSSRPASTGLLRYVLRNLQVGVDVAHAVVALRSESGCPAVGLPQVFVVDTNGRDTMIADAPGVANSLVLRNHVIVADPGIERFRELTRQIVGGLVGDESAIHFIDDRVYHAQRGEVHCATNVVRDHSLAFNASFSP